VIATAAGAVADLHKCLKTSAQHRTDAGSFSQVLNNAKTDRDGMGLRGNWD
jgi:hypothetical protein